MSKIEIYLGESSPDGAYRWRLRARNGRVIAIGEGYKTRSGAVAGAKAMQRAAATARWVFLDDLVR